jgi:hypothetical protein
MSEELPDCYGDFVCIDDKKVYDYHSFLFVDKLFKGHVKYGWCFEVELECKSVIQLTTFSKSEDSNQKVWCPVHQKFEEVLRWRKARLAIEK